MSGAPGVKPTITHRPRRIGFRESEARRDRQRGSTRSEMQKLTTGKFHGVSFPKRSRRASCFPLMFATLMMGHHFSMRGAKRLGSLLLARRNFKALCCKFVTHIWIVKNHSLGSIASCSTRISFVRRSLIYGKSTGEPSEGTSAPATWRPFPRCGAGKSQRSQLSAPMRRLNEAYVDIPGSCTIAGRSQPNSKTWP